MRKTSAKKTFEKAQHALEVAKNTYKLSLKFEKASPAQRRVMIAEDALLQLKARRYRATPGIYVEASDLAEEADFFGEVQLNTLLNDPKLKSSCKVCARGALLLSAVRHRNDCTIETDGSTSEDSHVEEFASQQEAIEVAFEDDESSWCDLLTTKERNDPDKRLELILKNIIRNKGTFKLTEK